MTKFSTINKEIKKGTVFTKLITAEFEINEVDGSSVPDDYDNVVLLASDETYGDIFKAYDDGEEDDFTLFFGVAGDEFNQ